MQRSPVRQLIQPMIRNIPDLGAWDFDQLPVVVDPNTGLQKGEIYVASRVGNFSDPTAQTPVNDGGGVGFMVGHWPRPGGSGFSQVFGPELVDTMNDASEWWPHGTNTVVQAGDGSIQITYVDAANGAFDYLNAANGLIRDLEDKEWVLITAQVEATGGDVDVVCKATAATDERKTVSPADGWADVALLIQKDDSYGDPFLRIENMAPGESAKVRNISVRTHPVSFLRPVGGELYPDTGLMTNTLSGVGVTVDQTGPGVLALNNNTYTGRWVDRNNGQIFEPGAWYRFTFTISELLNGSTGVRIRTGDLNLNHNAAGGYYQATSEDVLGVGTHVVDVQMSPDSTNNVFAGLYNLESGGSYGHRCTFFSAQKLEPVTFLGLGDDLVDTANDAAAWSPYGSNTVTTGADGSVEVAHVDNGGGATTALRQSEGLSQDLTDGAHYKLANRAKATGGDLNLRLTNMAGADAYVGLSDGAGYQTSGVVVSKSAGVHPIMLFNAMGGSEVANIRDISVRKITGYPAVQSNAGLTVKIEDNTFVPDTVDDEVPTPFNITSGNAYLLGFCVKDLSTQDRFTLISDNGTSARYLGYAADGGTSTALTAAGGGAVFRVWRDAVEIDLTGMTRDDFWHALQGAKTIIAYLDSDATFTTSVWGQVPAGVGNETFPNSHALLFSELASNTPPTVSEVINTHRKLESFRP